MNYKLYIGKISGIKIFIHWTFVLLIAWVVYNDIKAGLETADILWSVAFIFSIFGCVTLHELGHSLTAQRYHIKTRDITLLPIGGVASLESIPEKPKEELFVALAGPLVNIVIALILLPFVTWSEALEGLGQVGGSNFLLSLISVNITLAMFNMIPAFPMDGGRVLRALLSYKLDRVKATRIAASIGQVLALGFIVLGFYGNPFLAFIGVFIFLGAQAEARQVKSRALISGVRLRDVMMRDIPLLDSKLTIRDAAQQLLAGQNKTFVVMNEGRPVGTLSHPEIIKALGEQGENASLASAMDKDLLYLDAELSLESALKELQRSKKHLALVSFQNTLLGAVDIQNVTEFLLIRSAKQK